LKRQFKKEWDRDPELANQSLPSDSSIKREGRTIPQSADERWVRENSSSNDVAT
jgi:hypothetical protein